MTTTFILF